MLDQGAGRSEVRYYLMNAAKPPLDDLNARKAVAMAIDRNQINEIRNNGAYRVADGPFDTKVIGYTKNPGFPKFNLKQAKKLGAEYKAAHGGEFSVVLEHTNDPANTQEAEIIKEQLAKAGIDATLKQDDQTAFIVAAVSGNFSIMLWRQHPGDDPDAQYYWWNTGSTLNFGKFNDPTLQGLLDQGRTETDPAKRKQIYTDVNKRFASQVYNVWAYYADWVVGRQQEGAGPRGSAAARQGRQARRAPLRSPALARTVRDQVDLQRWRRSHGGCSNSSSSSSCRRCSRSHCSVSSRVTPPTRCFRYGTKAQKAQFRADNGLDKPFLEQYATWFGNLVQGDFGKDYQSNTPVADKLQNALPVSLQLMLYAQIMALVVAIPLGVFTAYRAGTKSDRVDQRRRVRAAGAAELRARARPRLLGGREVATRHTRARPDPGERVRAGLVGGSVRRPHRRPRQALRHHAAPVDRARRRTDRGVHAPAAQRHDRDAAGELHHDGPLEGPVRPAHPLASRARGRRASPCSPWPASTSARSSVARSRSR